MRTVFSLLFMCHLSLWAQSINSELIEKTKHTFPSTHVNKWLVVNKYIDHNDSVYFTEAEHESIRYQCWDEIAFSLDLPKGVLVADLIEKTVFEMHNQQKRRSNKGKSIVLDDSMGFLFEVEPLDTTLQTDSGFVIKSKDKIVNLTFDNSTLLLKHFENRYSNYDNSNPELLSTEWTLVDHSKSIEKAKYLTEYKNYIDTKQGEKKPVGVLLNFEFVDLNEE